MAQEDKTRWLAGTDKRFTVRGLGWYSEDRSFRRLPPRAKDIVPPGVWSNSLCSSGAHLCFRSDTAEMRVRVKVDGASRMHHMPATGQSGVALFQGEPYRKRPWGQAFPSPPDNTEYEGCLFSGVSRIMREYTLYLPLYNGVEKLQIGLSPGAKIAKPSPCVIDKPVVFYGTSITMGGCAHTPDGDYPSIIARRLNLHAINLGFSGAGRGEPEVAGFIAEIAAAMFVLDYAGNADEKLLRKTLPPFVQILRKKHPTTPILLLSRTLGYGAHYSTSSWQTFEARRDAIIHYYSRMRRAGDANIHFIDGNVLAPPCTDLIHSDGGHPTSVGFQMIADRLAPQLENILLARR